MQKRITIIAGGSSLAPSLIEKVVKSSDFIICVNGGYKNAMDADIVPDLIMGDLDSVDKDKVEYARKTGIPIRTFPAKKDESDLELALEEAVKMNPSQINIAGAMGKRFDHTLFNIMLLFKYVKKGLLITVLGNEEEIFIAENNINIENRKGKTVSLLPFTPEVTNVRIEGFYYPLEGEILHMGSTRGLSNIITKDSASIRYDEGLLLVILNG
jgi:thiamine pyrophosphokinase